MVNTAHCEKLCTFHARTLASELAVVSGVRNRAQVRALFRRVKNRCIEKKLFANNLSVDFDVFYPPEKDSLLRKLRALLFRSKAGYSPSASLPRCCPQPGFA